MSDLLPNVVNVKNQWLFEQVEVEFPTPESIKGRAVYQSLCERHTTHQIPELPLDNTINMDDIYLVDFHRLTVMFSLLESSRASTEQDQSNLLEFFTQIIFSEPCYLYVGFHQSEPVASAIVTKTDDQLLVSDLVVKYENSIGNKEQFGYSVIQKWLSENEFSGSFFIEV